MSIWSVAAFAQSLQPGWIADPRSGCRVWNGSPKPSETIAWSGGCANGLAQGRGVLQWYQAGKPNGRYEGEFRDGKENGRGVATWASGNRYEGEWRDGKAHGLGVYTKGSDTFNGIWRDGCFRSGERWALVGADESSCR